MNQTRNRKRRKRSFPRPEALLISRNPFSLHDWEASPFCIHAPDIPLCVQRRTKQRFASQFERTMTARRRLLFSARLFVDSSEEVEDVGYSRRPKRGAAGINECLSTLRVAHLNNPNAATIPSLLSLQQSRCDASPLSLYISSEGHIYKERESLSSMTLDLLFVFVGLYTCQSGLVLVSRLLMCPPIHRRKREMKRSGGDDPKYTTTAAERARALKSRRAAGWPII